MAGSGLLALLLHAAVIFFPESYALAQAHFAMFLLCALSSCMQIFFPDTRRCGGGKRKGDPSMENGMALEGIAAVAFSALFYVAMILVSRRFFVTRLRFARDRRAFDVKFRRDMLRKFLFLGYVRRFRQEGLLWLYGFFLADVACVLLASPPT